MYYLKPHIQLKLIDPNKQIYKLIDQKQESVKQINEYDIQLLRLISQYTPKELASILNEKESKILNFISHYYLEGYITSKNKTEENSSNNIKETEINIINENFNLLLLSIALIIIPLLVIFTN